MMTKFIFYGKHTVLLTLYTVFFLVFRVQATVFGCINNMERLVEMQKEIIENMKSYIGDVPKSKKDTIEKYVNLSEKENSVAIMNVSLFLANPVNCYVLVKRLTRDLNYVEDILKRFTEYKINQHLLYTLLYMPTEKDLNAATALIVLLVYIYDINVSEFANGTFIRSFRRSTEMFKAVSIPMTSSDCYEVALAAFRFKEYQIALAWFTEALRKYDEVCQDDCPFVELDIIKGMWRAHRFLDNLEHSLKQVTKQEKSSQSGKIKQLSKREDIMNYTATRLQNLSTLALLRQEQEDDNMTRPILTKWDYQRRHLCYKEHIQRNRLHCQHRYGPHPFLRLARFKAELLHLNPEIILFHDVISDREINDLKSVAEDKIQHTDVFEGKVNLRSVSLRHSVYINDRLSRVAAKITRRSLDISGLTTVMAESGKILNYGAGGFHKPHTDVIGYLTAPLIPAEATVLYSLSESDLGGATAFQRINFSVFPVKNSALYWRTLTPSGGIDENTVHASCPVLHGAKWGLTKWLSPPDVMQILKNKNISKFDTPLKLVPLSYDTLKHLKYL